MQYKAEIEQTETEKFKAAGFEVGYYGNQHKRSRGVRYYPAVYFKEENCGKIEAMGGKNIALIGH